jgi:hypothetical protein
VECCLAARSRCCRARDCVANSPSPPSNFQTAHLRSRPGWKVRFISSPISTGALARLTSRSRKLPSAAGPTPPTPALHPALQPSHRRTRINTKTFSRLPSRGSCFHCFNHTLPQVGRIRLRHRQPPQKRINTEQSLTSNPMGIPPIQIGRGNPLEEIGSRTNRAGIGNATARVHRATRERDGVASGGAGAAANDTIVGFINNGSLDTPSDI